MKLSRSAIVPALAAGLFLALIAPAAAATAAEPIDVVFFSNPTYTDVGEEDVELTNAIEAGGGVVTLFDGGDNSVATWAEALAEAEILVLPEAERGSYFPDAFGSDVAAYIAEWTAEGGLVILTNFGRTLPLLSAIVGVEFRDSVHSSDASELQIDAALPAVLEWADDTNSLYIPGLSAEQLAALTPVYAASLTIPVATIAVGEGQVLLLGYDWFPGTSDIENGIRADWDAVLAYFVQSAEPAAEPVVEEEPVAVPADTPAAAADSAQLAATGAEALPLIIGASALLLVGAGALLAARASVRRAG